jgi:HAD superfamily hydrolase (TIGR01549 family)
VIVAGSSWLKWHILCQRIQLPAGRLFPPSGGADAQYAGHGQPSDELEGNAVSVRAVVFDIGETLLDDTREYAAWADWIGIPRHTFSAVLGAVTADGRNNAETFQYFRPGFDLATERRRREHAGVGEQYEEADLYADARPALSALRAMGIWVGVAGNQTVRAGEILRGLRLPADLVATSGEWGVAKPDPAFFTRITEVAPGAPNEVVYVGDHRDNDLAPAKAAGLRTAFIRRGPWGYLWAADPNVQKLADWCIGSLNELPRLIHAQLGDH